MAGISIEGVSKTYADGTEAVCKLDLEIDDGMFLVLVGPSGCGKTTLLRMIAGLESVSSGTIRIGGREVDDLPPQDRDIAMVFQSYALYPHLSVRRNIGYGLRRRKLPKDQVEARVTEMAEVLELTDLLDKKPAALSGGQRQRVAMGRAIVREPQAFLMDEPLSNLDAKLRGQMRAEIARIQHDLGITTIYVTHDQVEAVTLGDLVCVMDGGQIQQAADPQTLFDEPASLFVANFIGSPAMNTIVGRLEAGEDGELWACVDGQRLCVPEVVVDRHRGLADRIGEEVAVGIRPEDIVVHDPAATGPDTRGRTLELPLELKETFGRIVDVHFGIERPVEQGRRLVARVGAAAAVGRELGERVTLEIAVEEIRFFDLQSGRSLAAAATAGAVA